MKLELNETVSSDFHLGCFGNFKFGDPVCRQLCILCLRCAIEKEQKSRLEILDELLSSEGVSEIIQ